MDEEKIVRKNPLVSLARSFFGALAIVVFFSLGFGISWNEMSWLWLLIITAFFCLFAK